MLQYLLAVTSVLLLGVAPGAVVMVLWQPSVVRDPVLWLAAAPAVTIGGLFAVAEGLSLMHVPLVPWEPLLVLAAVLAGGIAQTTGRGLIPAGEESERPTDPTATTGPGGQRAAVALLLLGILVGTVVWAIALEGQPHAPPSRDGEYHGYFVKRIAETGAVEPRQVLVTDPVTDEQAATFYPLALHTTIALQHQLMGLDIGLLLTVWMAMSAAAFLPAGLFVLVRRLVPDRPLAAGFTALIVPFFAMFPYRPAAWSAVSLIVGLALTPVAIVLVGRAGDSLSHRWRAAVPASLGIFGVAATHTSQLAFLALLLLVLEGASLWNLRGDLAAAGRRALNLLAVGGLTLALYLPSLMLLASAASERSAFAEAGYMTASEAMGSILNLSFAMPGTQAALAAMVLVGLWTATRDWSLGAWTVCLVATVALFLATAVSSGFWQLLRPITQPWYYSAWRTSYQVAFVGSVFAGYALAAVAIALHGMLRRRWPALSSAPAALGVAAALMVIGAPTLLGQPVDIVRDAYGSNARTTTSMLKAFDYLRQHTTPGETVLNEERDGSAWMYASHGLLPLLAVYRYDPSTQTEDRLYLATHIADFGTDPKVQKLAERWGIRYVMVNDSGFIDEPPRVRAADLRGKPHFEEVFSEAGSHVFRIVA